MAMRILVIDVGGTHVKFAATGIDEPQRFESGKSMTPELMTAGVLKATRDWEYDAVSIGIPGVVGPEGPLVEPGNLGPGWIGYNFREAFERPVRVVNDAVLQALGAYEGGRMLFLGLGTGLGSALIVDRVIVALELGDLPFSKTESLAERLGKAGLERHGEAEWRESVQQTVAQLRPAFRADYVVLGGGQVELLQRMPEATRRGGNEDAISGGYRLWEERVEPHDGIPSRAYRVLI